MMVFSAHQMGTCRMGKDPRTSVVNEFSRTHEVPNLYLVDGSSFVTSGRNQPTCTIQALAYRAACRLLHQSTFSHFPGSSYYCFFFVF